jgi:hypothetical protein
MAFCLSELFEDRHITKARRARLYGQVDPKRIHPAVTAHKHVAAMHQGDGFDDGQPQAMVGAAVAA